MPDITDYSPLWGVWNIEQLLGSGTFGDVYKAKRIDSGREYLSAIKHISIPPRSTNIQALRADGIVTDEASAMHYCDGLLGTLVKEIDICYELKGYTNFVSYEDHLIVPRQGDIGYDVFIRMELLTSLQDYIDSNGITVGGITKLCEDMCTAISVLEQKRIIHRDIKPANIFVSSTGDFKLGDFGVARHMEGLGSMSVKGTYNYMAPEILKGGTVSSNSDLYSLGLVLYRLLNSNRAPFLPPPPAQISYEEDQSALDRRLSGEPLNPPTKAELSLPLTNVIMRACEYEPSRRFQSANEMKQALQDFRNAQNSPTQNSNFDLDATVAVERSAMAGSLGGSFASWNQRSSSAIFPGSAQIHQAPTAATSKTMLFVLSSAVGVIALTLIVILAWFLAGNQKSNREETYISQAEEIAPTATSEVTPEVVNYAYYTSTESAHHAVAGDILQFGKYDWLVLDVQDGRALLITKDVISDQLATLTASNAQERSGESWETSSTRALLNDDFYYEFTSRERDNILTSVTVNDAHNGERKTIDKIFLLSEDEANKYFSDNSARIAYHVGVAVGWRLRTSMSSGRQISDAGDIAAGGLDSQNGGIRPALWVAIGDSASVILPRSLIVNRLDLYNPQYSYNFAELSYSYRVSDYEAELAAACILEFNEAWARYMTFKDEKVFAYLYSDSASYKYAVKHKNEHPSLSQRFVLVDVKEVRATDNYWWVWVHEKIEEQINNDTKLLEYHWVYKIYHDDLGFKVIDYATDPQYR